ncbi:MAG: hypothetical protein CMI32_02335, partial [Opitutales bacterium]|nr:hypothetical protein [Opitutales bacterium]
MSAWILLPALLLTATTWPGPLVGQDKPAPAADEEKDDEKKAGEKKGDDKQDGDVKADGKGKAPAGDKPSSSVEADATIQAEADARIDLLRSGQKTLSEVKGMTAADAATSISNLNSLTSLNLDFTDISAAMKAADMDLAQIFGDDYSGVAAILAAGQQDSKKLDLLVEAINDAFAGGSRSKIRRAFADVSTEDQKKLAFLETVVGFAESVAAPDSDFAKEVGSASGAWGKISEKGLEATLQGVEKRTVDATNFDAANVREEAAEQLTATSALIVSKLVEDLGDDVVDFTDQLNGAVAQKLVIDDLITEGESSLGDLVGANAETTGILNTAVASAEAVAYVSSEIANTIAADVAAGNSPTKTAFDPKLAGKKVADVIFQKAEKVKTEAIAAGGAFDDTTFSPAAGAKVAETVY